MSGNTDSTETYCVVGVRHDGIRVQVDEGVTFERAVHIKMLLSNANAFPKVEIERDLPQDPHSDAP